MGHLLDETLGQIHALDEPAMAAARARQDSLTKPQGSLGRLETLSIQLAGILGKTLPVIKNKAVIVMAADHGVTAEGVSLYPADVTAQMVANFARGGAAVSVMARAFGIRVAVVDIGVAGDVSNVPGIIHRRVRAGTANMAKGAAMSLDEAVKAVETGIETVRDEAARGLDIVGTGDMGIGNTTASSALTAVFTGKPVGEVTGGGTGLIGARLAAKVTVIERALALNRPDPEDPLDALAKVGGLEIAGLAGVMLGAAARRIPVVIDGFISGAAALVAAGLSPLSKSYMIAAHLSVEPGHRAVMAKLNLKPLLDLDMRLGEGTGAVLGIALAETSARILSEMATFGEAGVSGKEGA